MILINFPGMALSRKAGRLRGRCRFCRTCGAALFWKRDGTDYISVLAGSFDQPSGLKGASHIFVADKGDYYEIEGGAPQFPGDD